MDEVTLDVVQAHDEIAAHDNEMRVEHDAAQVEVDEDIALLDELQQVVVVLETDEIDT